MAGRDEETTRRGPLGPVAAERISAGCYGSLVATSTLVGLGNTAMGWLVAVVVLTNVIYWATHVFAYTIGDRSTGGLAQVALEHMRVSGPMVTAAFGPVIVVVLLDLLGVPQPTAVAFGAGWGLVTLAGVATTGAVLRGVRLSGAIAVAAVTIAFAAALVLLKLALH